MCSQGSSRDTICYSRQYRIDQMQRRWTALFLIAQAAAVACGCMRDSSDSTNRTADGTAITIVDDCNGGSAEEETQSIPHSDAAWRVILLESMRGCDRREATATSLLAVQNAPTLKGEEFDPIAAIRSINYFVVNGREHTVRALMEYATMCRSAAASNDKHGDADLDEDRVVLLGLALFGLPSAREAPPWMWVVGKAWMGWSSIDVETWGTFPLSLDSGVPFLLASGYRWGSVSKDALGWFSSFEKGRPFRNAILSPRTSPHSVRDAILSQARQSWLGGGQAPSETLDHLRRFLTLQAGRCVASRGDSDEYIWSGAEQKYVRRS